MEKKRVTIIFSRQKRAFQDSLGSAGLFARSLVHSHWRKSQRRESNVPPEVTHYLRRQRDDRELVQPSGVLDARKPHPGQPGALHRQRSRRAGIRHLAPAQVQTHRESQIRTARHRLQSRESPDLFQPIRQHIFVQLRAYQQQSTLARPVPALRGALNLCCARSSS